MAQPNYCRRESCKTKGGARITKANSLNWCEDCRSHLPFWPQADGPEADPGSQYDYSGYAEQVDALRAHYGKQEAC